MRSLPNHPGTFFVSASKESQFYIYTIRYSGDLSQRVTIAGAEAKWLLRQPNKPPSLHLDGRGKG